MFEKVLEIYAFLFGRPRFLRLNRFIFNLSMRGLGIQNYKNFKQSGEDKFLEVFAKIHKRDKRQTVFDVGANRGDYVKLVLGKFKNTPVEIFAFEPGREQFKYMQSNYLKPNVHIFNVACGEKSGECFLYLGGDGGEFSSLYPSVFKGDTKIKPEKIKVKTVKLDDIVYRQKLNKINLLKIDTEGSEFEVLRGCLEAIDSRIIEMIQFEFNSMNIVRGIFLRDFITLLKGYSLYRLLPKGAIKIDFYDPLYWEIFSFQNFVAVRRDLVKKFERNYAK
jgi:FkbM family methyltransferase